MEQDSFKIQVGDILRKDIETLCKVDNLANHSRAPYINEWHAGEDLRHGVKHLVRLPWYELVKSKKSLESGERDDVKMMRYFEEEQANQVKRVVRYISPVNERGEREKPTELKFR